MRIEVLKSKIHRAKITQAELHYVGSISIDEDLMDAANLIEGEKVQIVNVNNGERLETYVIKGVPGRLLFHFLRIYAESGRCDFTNREVRLQSTLRLPDLKDNLETRLILLRRRLDERRMPVRLSRPGRGQIRLEVEGNPQLELIDK